MKKTFTLLALSAAPLISLATCNLNVSSNETLRLNLGIQKHSTNIRTIAAGYGKLNPNKSIWLHSMIKDIQLVQTELLKVSDYTIIRSSITGSENKAIITSALKEALSQVSQSAVITKNTLLESSATIENPAVTSEFSQVIIILSDVAALGYSCR